MIEWGEYLDNQVQHTFIMVLIEAEFRYKSFKKESMNKKFLMNWLIPNDSEEYQHSKQSKWHQRIIGNTYKTKVILLKLTCKLF